MRSLCAPAGRALGPCPTGLRAVRCCAVCVDTTLEVLSVRRVSVAACRAWELNKPFIRCRRPSFEAAAPRAPAVLAVVTLLGRPKRRRAAFGIGVACLWRTTSCARSRQAPPPSWRSHHDAQRSDCVCDRGAPACFDRPSWLALVPPELACAWIPGSSLRHQSASSASSLVRRIRVDPQLCRRSPCPSCEDRRGEERRLVRVRCGGALGPCWRSGGLRCSALV